MCVRVCVFACATNYYIKMFILIPSAAAAKSYYMPFVFALFSFLFCCFLATFVALF